MGIEIEKKYRLTREEAVALERELERSGARFIGEEFEENTIYAGGALDPQRQVLRVRRTASGTTLAYKERALTNGAIKHQREEETRIESGEAIAAILCALGFHPALVYEKKRRKWRFAEAEVVIDELPFGIYAEIEGDAEGIDRIERELGLESAEIEHDTYPQLAARHGVKRDNSIEARFVNQSESD
jgi:adenylate cyclase class 2